jgi:transposase
MEKIFEKALGVESPWFIEATAFDVNEKRLDIRIGFKRGWRFPLEEGGPVYPVHDTEEKTWRHLNFFQHECYLHVRVPRVRTDDGRTITALPPWAGCMLGFTLLFEALLLELCRNMPVAQVARMTNVSSNKLWRMLELYVEAARFDEDCGQLVTVGIDETSVAKGHDYISLFVDMEQRKTLHIAEGKGSETVKDFADYLTAHQGDPEQITSVSCDMSPAFIKGVNDNLPKAEITFDKFHIIKIINEAVDDVRRQEAKTNPLLKKTRYIFLKNEKNLTDKQRAKKAELMLPDLNLQTMEALRMRETFQQIYHAETEESFIALVRQWLDWVLPCDLLPMRKAAQTVERHLTGIHNWMRSKINNGILEGLNSIIQAAKRKARGYGRKHFATIAFLLTGKLNLQKLNPFLPTRFG